ncbi:hypothetical protein BD410DRAFT_54675 [Rickenella mellea]|uniref:Uncharacterized protein n=1 Tax=Rickenella mellea TaxID=50990 RepID=A0A4R5XG62_9AGAM|nr:hypothetical protein BD410DRAFT_54675 [Rickenella mellea]
MPEAYPCHGKGFIDSKTVEGLLCLLSRVKIRGGEVTAEVIQESSNLEAADEDSRMSTVYSSKQLKSYRNGLQTLLRVTDSMIEEFESGCILFSAQKGINSLPDEILRIIFEIGHDDQDFEHGSELSLAVSGVSRQFRRVALESPWIWRRLSNNQSVGQLELFITRSRTVGLEVAINPCEDPYIDRGRHQEYYGKRIAIPDFMDIVTKQSHRWTSFYFATEDRDEEIPELSEYPLLNLPLLTSLTCDFEPTEGGGDEDEISYLFDDWRTPNLRRVCIMGGAVIEIPEISSDLTSCDLRFYAPDLSSCSEFDPDQCVNLRTLYSLTSLVTLSLHFHGIHASQCISELTSITLPNLKSLDTSFRLCAIDRVIQPLFAAFQFPELINLTINLIQLSEIDYFLALSKISIDAKRYPSIQTLRLAIGHHIVSMDDVPGFCTDLPSLTEVIMEGMDFIRNPRGGLNISRFPRKIRFKCCDTLDDVDLANIIDAAEKNNQELEFVNCRSLSPLNLRKGKARLGGRLRFRI